MSKSGTPGDLTPRGCCWSALCCHTKNTEGSHFNDKSFVWFMSWMFPPKVQWSTLCSVVRVENQGRSLQ